MRNKHSMSWASRGTCLKTLRGVWSSRGRVTCFLYSTGENASDVNDLRHNLYSVFCTKNREIRERLNNVICHLAKTAFVSTLRVPAIKHAFRGTVCSAALQPLTPLDSDGRWET